MEGQKKTLHSVINYLKRHHQQTPKPPPPPQSGWGWIAQVLPFFGWLFVAVNVFVCVCVRAVKRIPAPPPPKGPGGSWGSRVGRIWPWPMGFVLWGSSVFRRHLFFFSFRIRAFRARTSKSLIFHFHTKSTHKYTGWATVSTQTLKVVGPGSGGANEFSSLVLGVGATVAPLCHFCLNIFQ